MLLLHLGNYVNSTRAGTGKEGETVVNYFLKLQTIATITKVLPKSFDFLQKVVQHSNKDKFHLKCCGKFFFISWPKYTTEMLPHFGTEFQQHTAHILARSWKCRGA